MSLVEGNNDRFNYRNGTARVATPEDTWQALTPLLGAAGITRVADLTWLDDIGIPTVQAVRPGLSPMSVSQGKALTLTAAKVSAVMESLESWHAEHVVPELVGVTADELAGELTYDPHALALATGSLYHGALRCAWIRATGLLTGRATWLPLEAARLNVKIVDEWAPPTFAMNSNGLASGNTYDEAALHGLYELVERDSSCRTAGGRGPRRLDPDSVTDATCAGLIEAMRRADNNVDIADETCFAGLYCFTADLRSASAGITFAGAGCHHDPAVALSRALTEAAQSRLTAISGAREDLAPSVFDLLSRADRRAPRAVRRAGPLRAFSFSTGTEFAGPRAALLAAAKRVHEHTGIEPLAAVLPSPHAHDGGVVGVPVVQVCAPGLTASATVGARIPLASQGS